MSFILNLFQEVLKKHIRDKLSLVQCKSLFIYSNYHNSKSVKFQSSSRKIPGIYNINKICLVCQKRNFGSCYFNKFTNPKELSSSNLKDLKFLSSCTLTLRSCKQLSSKKLDYELINKSEVAREKIDDCFEYVLNSFNDDSFTRFYPSQSFNKRNLLTYPVVTKYEMHTKTTPKEANVRIKNDIMQYPVADDTNSRENSNIKVSSYIMLDENDLLIKNKTKQEDETKNSPLHNSKKSYSENDVLGNQTLHPQHERVMLSLINSFKNVRDCVKTPSSEFSEVQKMPFSINSRIWKNFIDSPPNLNTYYKTEKNTSVWYKNLQNKDNELKSCDVQDASSKGKLYQPFDANVSKMKNKMKEICGNITMNLAQYSFYGAQNKELCSVMSSVPKKNFNKTKRVTNKKSLQDYFSKTRNILSKKNTIPKAASEENLNETYLKDLVSNIETKEFTDKLTHKPENINYNIIKEYSKNHKHEDKSLADKTHKYEEHKKSGNEETVIIFEKCLHKSINDPTNIDQFRKKIQNKKCLNEFCHKVAEASKLITDYDSEIDNFEIQVGKRNVLINVKNASFSKKLENEKDRPYLNDGNMNDKNELKAHKYEISTDGKLVDKIKIKNSSENAKNLVTNKHKNTQNETAVNMEKFQLNQLSKNNTINLKHPINDTFDLKSKVFKESDPIRVLIPDKRLNTRLNKLSFKDKILVLNISIKIPLSEVDEACDRNFNGKIQCLPKYKENEPNKMDY